MVASIFSDDQTQFLNRDHLPQAFVLITWTNPPPAEQRRVIQTTHVRMKVSCFPVGSANRARAHAKRKVLKLRQTPPLVPTRPVISTFLLPILEKYADKKHRRWYETGTLIQSPSHREKIKVSPADDGNIRGGGVRGSKTEAPGKSHPRWH